MDDPKRAKLVDVRGRDRPTVEVSHDETGVTIAVSFELRPDGWAHLHFSKAQLAQLRLLCGKKLLKWVRPPGEKFETAVLGTAEDGVQFTLSVHPTCYRRGPYRLLIEVFGGEFHHAWGCFDEQDQPTRNFHSSANAKLEAEALAAVLLEDRLKVGKKPAWATPAEKSTDE